MAKSILIVDDEQQLAELFAIYFEDQGFITDVAYDAFQAEQKIAEKDYDVILSDIRMPKRDGVELLKMIRQRDPQKPVMFMMSGYSQYSEADVKALGAKALISKPVAMDALLGVINAQLDL